MPCVGNLWCRAQIQKENVILIVWHSGYHNYWLRCVIDGCVSG